MTVLDVKIIGSTIASDMADVEPDTSLAALTETFFFLLVSLTVNGRDVLRTSSFGHMRFLQQSPSRMRLTMLFIFSLAVPKNATMS
jgi:hypothetical protein